MVFAILVETTSPIRILRRPCVFSAVVAVIVVVSAMGYFFSVAAVFVWVLPAAFFTFATLGAFGTFGAFVAFAAFATGAAAFTLIAPLPPASCFSRSMVLIRAMSFFRSRIFFRLSVWPIFN